MKLKNNIQCETKILKQQEKLHTVQYDYSQVKNIFSKTSSLSWLVDTDHTSIEKSPVTKNQLNSGSALCFKYVIARKNLIDNRICIHKPPYTPRSKILLYSCEISIKTCNVFDTMICFNKLGDKNTEHLMI